MGTFSVLSARATQTTFTMASCTYWILLTVLAGGVIGSTMRPRNTLHPWVTPTTCMIPANIPHAWKKETFPNPWRDVTLCGRNCRSSWVCDPSGIIDPKDADYLDNQIHAIATNGRCGCRNCVVGKDGYSISVALVQKMAHDSFVVVTNVDKNNEAMEFSAYLRSVSWRFGKCENSIVIFYSKDDRKVFTSTGPTVKRLLTINCTGDIYNEAKPMFKEGKVAAALEHMVSRYGQVLSTGQCHPPPEPTELGVGIIILIVIVCIVVLIAVVVGSVFGVQQRRRHYHRGRSHDPDTRRRGADDTRDDKDKKFEGGETGDGGGVAGGSF